jgi:asparagine synthase (glutamine-hydrolysing)
VPIGIFLSGGIDSTALLALARASGHQQTTTFSMTLPGSPADEGATARRTAHAFNANHHELPMDAATARRAFTDYLGAADQPSIDGLNTFVVARFARLHGVNVALSGVGADELFGGYRSFRDIPRIAKWDNWLGRLGPVRSAAGRLIERLAPGPRARRVGDLMSHPGGLTAAYASFRGIFTRSEAQALASHYGNWPSDQWTDEDQADTVSNETPPDAVSRLELTRYVRNQLLRETDVMSMANGVEIRTPFLDSGVIQHVAAVPAAIRLRAGKRLLIDAVPEIPEWVTNRPKGCFQFPFDQWLNDEWGDVFGESSRRCPVPTETWYRQWSVFVFEQWLSKATRVSIGQRAPELAAGGRIDG